MQSPLEGARGVAPPFLKLGGLNAAPYGGGLIAIPASLYTHGLPRPPPPFKGEGTYFEIRTTRFRQEDVVGKIPPLK